MERILLKAVEYSGGNVELFKAYMQGAEDNGNAQSFVLPVNGSNTVSTTDADYSVTSKDEEEDFTCANSPVSEEKGSIDHDEKKTDDGKLGRKLTLPKPTHYELYGEQLLKVVGRVEVVRIAGDKVWRKTSTLHEMTIEERFLSVGDIIAYRKNEYDADSFMLISGFDFNSDRAARAVYLKDGSGDDPFITNCAPFFTYYRIAEDKEALDFLWWLQKKKGFSNEDMRKIAPPQYRDWF